jgi:5-oxoprolinase (ATP-hydrolysing) subunit A
VSAAVINLNVDVGESFGNYSFGADAELLPLVPTANVACGAHAGDPRVMRETVALAVEHDVEIGAHVSLPDLLGFGRRVIEIDAVELRDTILFQIGALSAFTTAPGTRLAHVKPHGVLYRLCGERDDYAEALISAVADFDPGLRVITGGARPAEAGRSRRIEVTHEGYVDLAYRPDGYPIVERRKQRSDPAEVATRAVTLATTGQSLVAGTGEPLRVDAPTLCLHGDAPGAAKTARAVRDALREAEIGVVGLAQAMQSWTPRMVGA